LRAKPKQTSELQAGAFKPIAKRGIQGDPKTRALLPQDRELGYHHKNAKNQMQRFVFGGAHAVVASLSSCGAARRDA
jgi:hypothetical protein